MRDWRSLRIGCFAGLLGALSFLAWEVQPALAWKFLPKEGLFAYPWIDGVGYVTPTPPAGMGRVVTTRAEQAVLIGEGEVVYVDVGTQHGIKAGDRLMAFSIQTPRELGGLRMVTMEARLRVTQVKETESEAVVEESYRSLSLGSRVDRYQRFDPNIPLKPAPKAVTGNILWNYENQPAFGDGDVVFLNRGTADGVEPGQCYQIFRVPVEGLRQPPASGHLTTGIGEMVILKVQDRTSSALITKSQLPLAAGDRFRAGCAWEAKLAQKPPPPPPPPPPAPAAAPEDALRKAFENIDVRFAYDSFLLSEEARRILQDKAKFLKERPEVQALIEGHCDERGTESYNLALGDRRAFMCKRYLMELGIPEGRMRTVSFGKERPLDPGHNEAAWSKNRRAHFVIQKP